MRESDSRAPSVEVFASRTLRVAMGLGFCNGVLLLAIGLIRLLSEDDAVVGSVGNMLAGLWLGGYFGWVGYSVWRRPVLQLDMNEIRWLPIGSRRPQRIRVADVTGFRWPYPADLWIEGGTRSPLRVHMVGISKCDRARVREWFIERWADGGLVV